MQTNLTFILFISILITIYSLLNYYFLKKHNNIITSKSLPSILWKLLIITMIFTPILTTIFSGLNNTTLATYTGFPGYSWLAFLFIFLIIHGFIDLFVFIFEKIGIRPPKSLNKEIFITTMILSISILFYGFFEAKNYKIEYVQIKTIKLPEDTKKIKIIQLSDIHFSPLTSTDTAIKIKEIINKEKPDLILSTGDILDKSIRDIENIIKILKNLKAPLGKFAILGNHEFLAGIDYSQNFIKKSGFTILRNESISLNNKLNLAGVDDKTGKNFGIIPLKKEIELLQKLNTNRYTILLKHQPTVNKKSTNFFDLQLSGHTHAGQLFPFTILVKVVFPYFAGMYEIENNKKIYVSRGTGTWGPPFRFLAKPEITVIELINNNF